MENICLSLAFCLSVLPQFAQARESRETSKQPTSTTQRATQRTAEVCVRKPSEIARNPEIADALAGFGGIAQFEGNWKMTGFLSVFAKAQVGLSHSRNGFAVEINKQYSKAFYMCVSEARPDLITMYIQQAENPDFAKLILKPGRTGETIYVGAAKTGWKFLKFKRP